ncbi:MAG: RimK-like ATPgrasp N-terminal domain-containing protein, partial [Methylococcaceae bacterium]|nr:RimK-like ATPgrasp N-terminal domain-containing protein [Methylococcaceae bacterium]
MASTLLVVDNLSDWNPYYPSEQVITFENYLATEQGDPDQRVRVINLCTSYAYLSDGYYCSLLAEARNHHVIPSVKVINDLGKNALYRLQLEDLTQPLARAFKHQNKNGEFILHSYFGTTSDPAFQELARLLFERF